MSQSEFVQELKEAYLSAFKMKSYLEALMAEPYEDWSEKVMLVVNEALKEEPLDAEIRSLPPLKQAEDQLASGFVVFNELLDNIESSSAAKFRRVNRLRAKVEATNDDGPKIH